MSIWKKVVAVGQRDKSQLPDCRILPILLQSNFGIVLLNAMIISDWYYAAMSEVFMHLLLIPMILTAKFHKSNIIFRVLTIDTIIGLCCGSFLLNLIARRCLSTILEQANTTIIRSVFSNLNIETDII